MHSQLFVIVHPDALVISVATPLSDIVRGCSKHCSNATRLAGSSGVSIVTGLAGRSGASMTGLADSSDVSIVTGLANRSGASMTGLAGSSDVSIVTGLAGSSDVSIVTGLAGRSGGMGVATCRGTGTSFLS